MKVRNLKIRKIIATNVQKTIELELETSKGIVRSSVPIGTSRSKYEVVFLDVEDVIRKFSLIKKHFLTREFKSQKDVDSFLRLIDKSPNFKEIGGNLALGISSVFLKAFALEEGKEVFEFLLKGNAFLPKPICNVAGGWAGTGAADIQEFLFVPIHQKSFLDSVMKIADSYVEVGKALKEKDPNFVFSKNIESGWVSGLPSEEILSILTKIANENTLKIGLDVAASHLWDGTYYNYGNSGIKLSRPEQRSFMEEIAKKYPIYYIEDPFHEDDFLTFSFLTKKLQPKLICGDDLYSTNLERLKCGLEQKATNAILIKPNQVGTITDVMNVIKEARKEMLVTVMSHRSGETEDTLICHLAVGLGCEFIKLGIGGERALKINELIRIEEKLKS